MGQANAGRMRGELVEGARLAVIAVVAAVLSATAVINAGAALMRPAPVAGAAAPADQPQLILASATR